MSLISSILSFLLQKKVFIFLMTELSGQLIVEIKLKFKNGTTMVPFKFYDFQTPHTTQFLTNCGVVLYVTQRSLDMNRLKES